MPKQKNDSAPSPVKPGMPEPTTDSAEAVASEETAGAGNQAVPPLSISISPQATAPEQVKNDDLGKEESQGMKNGALDPTTIRYTVDPAVASDVQEMAERVNYRRDPWKRSPVPTRQETYGTTDELFARITQTIVEQTQLSDKDSKLLAIWAISSWFQDVLPITPGLVITGWAYEGEVVLRTLRAFCHKPILVAGLTSATLNDIYMHWQKMPTLLISEPSLTKRMATILGCSTSRGYLAPIKMDRCPTFGFDYFGSKAIYLGENPPMKSLLQCYLHINASTTTKVYSNSAPLLSEKVMQHFQNQLEDYRNVNWKKIIRQRFNALGFSPEVHEIANAFGQCIVDAADLREELIALLTPCSDQQIAERLDDLGTLCLSAALRLCHQGKTQILVGEIAAEVNRDLKARGEKLQHSPEKVGHKLKNVGLPSRRLGPAGKGFLFDHGTQVFFHKVAAVYGCVGLADGKQNMHCSLCEQYK